MQFVKTYWISLLCGVLAIGFVAAATMGMMSTEIEQKLEEKVRNAGTIDSLSRNAQNEDTIAAAARQGQLFERAYSQAMEEAREINRRQPLIDKVFPKPANALTTPFDFLDAYKRAVINLRTQLSAGMPPSDAEIENERINIEEQQRLEEQAAGEAEQGDLFGNPGQEPRRGGRRGSGPSGPMGNPYNMGGRMSGPMGGMGRMGSGPPSMYGGRGSAGGMGRGNIEFDEDAPQYDPAYRAAVKKARSIRMYVDAEAFHITDVLNVEQAPEVSELWYAQMLLWIQQDIVRAIAQFNEQAAANVATEDAYVEQMPIKRLEQILVHDYRVPDQPIAFPAPLFAQQRKPIVPEDSFTGRESDDEFDVVRFTVVVWVDQRQLLQVIDVLSRANFYQCVDVDYQSPTPENLSNLYMFGTDPVVRAKLQFEGYFSRTAYKEWMPPDVRQQLGIDPPDEDD